MPLDTPAIPPLKAPEARSAELDLGDCSSRLAGEDQRVLAPLFWEQKSLSELSAPEWEALCDGCGRCCLHKLEDEDTGQICYTNVACRLLDLKSCRCSSYSDRHTKVAACIPLSRQNIKEMDYMPATCAYRLVAEGKPLPEWHHLVSGDPQSVHKAGMSVRSLAVSEEGFTGDLEDQVLEDFL